MLNFVDTINESNILTEDSVLVSFDTVKKFPSIDNVSGLEAVSEFLENRKTGFPTAECILEALKLCLECNNFVFNGKFYLQEDGTAIGSHISCSYIGITMYRFDLKVLCWARFGDDLCAKWNHSLQGLYNMNSIDASGKIKFTMTIANNDSRLSL